MWLLLSLSLARAEVVDQILHVVGERLVTASDVAFERELDPYDQSPVAPLEDPTYPVEWRLVDYAVVRDAAGDVDVFKPTGSEVDARWDRFRAAWPTPEAYAGFLTRWGIDDESLKGFFYSRLVVEHFITRNLAVAGPTVGYAEWMVSMRSRAVIRSPASP